jgi:hypothetical protein
MAIDRSLIPPPVVKINRLGLQDAISLLEIKLPMVISEGPLLPVALDIGGLTMIMVAAIHFTSKFPLVIIFLLIAFFVVPGCAVILALYLLVTVAFAIPSFLVLYFAYPTLERLVREITS